jgi:hypothetical protein
MASHPVHLVHPVEILGVSADNSSIVNNLDATPLELVTGTGEMTGEEGFGGQDFGHGIGFDH